MKLKIKPSAKIHRRYLLIEARSKKEIEQTILEYIGILGWAKAAPKFVKTSSKNHVLAIERKELTNVRAAFEASDKKIKTLKVSGTLKGLK
jgi:RNase P/RNase MRP subunit POP5